MSDRKDRDWEVYPFLEIEEDQYDLNRWNEEYWQRFERLLSETEKRGIFIQIEIWDRFDYTDNRSSNRWQIHPYNPKNNINYSYEESGFAETYPDHPGKNKQSFFFTTPGQQNNLVVLRFQQRFVDKLMDHSLRYKHVLYCIDNETSAEETWARYWAEYIKTRAKAEGKQIFITEMWDDWDLTAERHRRTFNHPELYDFVDVSQNNHNKGQKHWDNFLHVRQYLSNQPRPINTTKTYGADGNKFGHTDQDAIERFWRHLLAGAASMRFHRPPSGLGQNEKAIAAIQAARKLESIIPLWTVTPANEFLLNREDNEAYLAANHGQAYALYFPAGGDIEIDFSSENGSLEVSWININSGNWGPKQNLIGGKKQIITAPDNRNWVAAIIKKN